ncbi:MAG: hypothetical protein WC873_02385 [Candidatus Gracilibacteria bacterium]
MPITIGILAGTVMGLTMVSHAEENTVTNIWDDIVSYGNLFEWQDVFGAVGLSEDKQGKDLYKLIYNKLLVRPDDDSFKAVAQNYGLTKQEAEDVANGSISTIYHSSHMKGSSLKAGKMTQAEAIALSDQLINDLNDYRELFTLQQEVDAATAQSELFSNGDVADSGFDLVYDLSVIEQVLFLSNTEISVGATFENQLDSPVPKNSNPPQYESPDGAGTPDGVTFSEEGGETTAKISLGGDKSLTAPVLDGDVCTSEDNLLEALGEYESTLPPTPPAGDDDDEGEATDTQLSQSDVPAATADSWGSVFCPEFNDPKERDANPPVESLGLGFSQEGDAEEGETSFTVSLPLCLTIELIKDKASSYTAGSDQCVKCEVDQINKLFEKTLMHSLVPNKVTGNYLEGAKCKETFDVPLIDIKVLPIPAPILTPPKDDLIFGNNIFEEWNKFVGRLGWKDLLAEDEYIEEFELRNLPSGISNIEALVDIQGEKARNRVEALDEMADIQTALTGGQNNIYSQALLPEMRQMTVYFERFKKVFEETAVVCKSIVSKPTIQGKNI